MSDLILLGYITSAFGIKGGVSVKLINDDSALSPSKKLTIRCKKQVDRSFTVSEAVSFGRLFFDEITDRTAAEALKGCEIFIDRQDLPTLADDEFYLCDLLGGQVFLVGEKLLGEIVDFTTNNAQTLLEVKTNSGALVSIPLIKPIVQKIDYEKKLVFIDPPVGLLDLD